MKWKNKTKTKTNNTRDNLFNKSKFNSLNKNKIKPQLKQN